MRKFRNIVVLVPQNKNQFVKLRLQFFDDQLAILAEADKGEEGENDSLELINSLHAQLKKDGIVHEVYTRNRGRMNLIDHLVIPLKSEIKSKLYDYIAMGKKGKEIKGVIMAKNKASAIDKLRWIGYFPTRVTECKRKV